MTIADRPFPPIEVYEDLEPTSGEPVRSISIASQWPKPDPAVLRQGRRSAPKFPTHLFGNQWAEWLRAATESTGAPVDYTAAALLAAAATMIGGARDVIPWGDWREPSVLWFGLVGDPSSGKSPGADPVLRAVRAIEREDAADLDERHRVWEAEAKAAQVRRDAWEATVEKAANSGGVPPPLPADAELPREPKPPRLLISDATIERAASLCVENSRGLLHFRDELAGWLGNLDRYGGAGGDRAFWIEAFGARPYVIDRVKNGGSPITIHRLAIAILGAIQPDKLAATMLRDGDDGLASRFLWTWPDPLPPTRPTRIADQRMLVDALRRLRNLRPADDGSPVALMLSDGAADLFHAWRHDHARESAAATGMVASAAGKAPGQVLRLAVVLELLLWAIDATAPEPDCVGEQSIARATSMITDYWLPMAARVYGDASLPPAERGAATIARWLLAGERRSVLNARALRREARLPGLRTADAVTQACACLCDADWLRTWSPPTGGRRRSDYEINPAIWDLKR